jgi:very-short-patch-repair endonuclease
VEREVRLAAVAEAQGGAFTVSQALAVGFTKPAIRHALATGRWTRLRRGVLTPAARAVESPAGTPAWQFWLVLQAHAALLVAPRGAVVSHLTAALLWQLPLPSASALPVHLTVPPHRDPSTARGLVLHRCALPESEVRGLLGVLVTTVARTLVDLARALALPAAVVAWDAALREDRVDREELTMVAETTRGWPGSRAVQAALAVADPSAESPLETLARLLFRHAGLVPFETQVEIFLDGQFIARVDFLWRRQRLVVEVDGTSKYDDVRRIRRERQRDGALLAAGYRVLHLSWAQVVHEPEQTVARLRRLLATATA